MKNARRGNRLGVLSVALTLVFWAFVNSHIGPNAFTESPYVFYVLCPGVLLVAGLAAIAAAVWGSRWWLLALVGPVWGVLLIFTAGV